MIAIDTDVLTDILLGTTRFAQRVAAVPAAEQAVPVIVVEEILRGRLGAIRHAESGKGRLTVPQAYALFLQSVSDFQRLTVLPYTSRAESLFQQWRVQKVRVSTHDLRIAAICVDHAATLISRNRRDFDRVPGLSIEYWD